MYFKVSTSYHVHCSLLTEEKLFDILLYCYSILVQIFTISKTMSIASLTTVDWLANTEMRFLSLSFCINSEGWLTEPIVVTAPFIYVSHRFEFEIITLINVLFIRNYNEVDDCKTLSVFTFLFSFTGYCYLPFFYRMFLFLLQKVFNWRHVNCFVFNVINSLTIYANF